MIGGGLPYAIIDTSSILFGISIRKDIFESVRAKFPKSVPLVSRGVLRELGMISKNKGARGASAGAALALVKAKRVKVEPNAAYVDSWISSAAARYINSIVVTNDTALFRKLRGAGTNVFRLSKSGILRK